MGDAIRYLCCSLFRSVYLEGLQNSVSLSTGRAKIIAKKKLFSQPPFVRISTPNWYQYSTKSIRLCSNFLLLFLSSVIPSAPLGFFFPTATSMLTTPLKQHLAEALLCRADKSLKNPGLSFAGSWSGGGETCLMPLTAVLNERCL